MIKMVLLKPMSYYIDGKKVYRKVGEKVTVTKEVSDIYIRDKTAELAKEKSEQSKPKR